MELRSSLRLLRERWILIILVTVIVTGTSGVLTWRETPQYASEVTMFVSAGIPPEDPASAYHGGLLSQQKVKSYAELLREWYLMGRVIHRLDLDLTAAQLAGKVTTTAVPETALLTATVQDPSPARAQRIADAIGDEFVTLIPELEGVDENGQPVVRATVVGPALQPTVPVSPRPVRNIGLATALGLLLGLALAVARRALDTSVKAAEQVEQVGDAPSLGAVPFDSSAGKRPLVNPAYHGPRVEALRKIAANLQFVDVDQSHKSLAVTSAAPNEGKSVTTCNLAIALVETGKRVMVVDADLRRPSVGRYLGLPNGAGLTSVLLRRADLDAATQTWGDPGFSVLTSGPAPPNPTSLLGSQQLRELLAELRERYDVVLIDSSPVLPVADAPVLAAACDGVIMVVRYGKTRQEQLRRAVEGLAAADVTVLGTVLNAIPRVRGNYDQYRYAQLEDGAEPVSEQEQAAALERPEPAGDSPEPQPSSPVSTAAG